VFHVAFRVKWGVTGVQRAPSPDRKGECAAFMPLFTRINRPPGWLTGLNLAMYNKKARSFYFLLAASGRVLNFSPCQLPPSLPHRIDWLTFTSIAMAGKLSNIIS
jgi:hypothetical protein